MSEPKPAPASSRRMPKNSVLYDKLVPIVLMALGLITVTLIVVAAGVLFGVIAPQ